MTSKLRMVFIATIIATTVLVSGLLIDKNDSSIASDQPSTDVSLGVEKNQEIVVQLYFDNLKQLNTVASELDIWEVHPTPWMGQSAGYALAAVYPAQKDWLAELGYRVEVDQKHTVLLQTPLAELDPRYYYFDDNNPNPNDLYIVSFLHDINTAFPDKTELFDIGDAWRTNHGGPARDMWVLRISNEDTRYGEIADKPPFFLFADIHSREVTTSELAIRYIKYLTTGYLDEGGYGDDPDVTWLVDHHVVYVLVTQNPDGHVVDEQNWLSYWRKNLDYDDGCSTPSSWGVDLNRNHSFLWGCCGGSSGSPCAETYRGPSKGSEPETAAFEAFVSGTAFTDQNGSNDDVTIVPAPDNTTGIFISLHSYADEIYWPFNHDVAPNNAQLMTIGRKLAVLTDNVMNPAGSIWYTVDGTTDNWVYGKLGVAAFTFEVGDYSVDCGDFFPSYDCQDGTNGASRNFWGDMKESFVYANKIARTPYLTSYGPDASNLAVDPASVPIGSPINISAIIDDLRFGIDPLKPIAGAEYFVDEEGIDGTGITMDPSDGAWGEIPEPVEGVVNTSGMDVGDHYVLVHGKNNLGDWGPFTAIFFNLSEPDAPLAGFNTNSPVQLGQPMIFTNSTIGLEPITYLWDFGDESGTSTEENPSYTYLATGVYSVTLTATNDLGNSSIKHQVEVIPPAIDSIIFTKVTHDPIHPGDTVDFSADLAPDNAGKPYAYGITFGDGHEETGLSSDDPLLLPHIYSLLGDYTLQIQVKNDSMLDPITASLDIMVVENLYKVYLPLTLSK